MLSALPRPFLPPHYHTATREEYGDSSLQAGMEAEKVVAPRRLPSSCDLSQQVNADLRPLNPLVVPMLSG